MNKSILHGFHFNLIFSFFSYFLFFVKLFNFSSGQKWCKILSEVRRLRHNGQGTHVRKQSKGKLESDYIIQIKVLFGA